MHTIGLAAHGPSKQLHSLTGCTTKQKQPKTDTRIPTDVSELAYGIVMKSIKHVHDEEDIANQLFGAVPTTFNESRTVFGMTRGSVFSTT